MVPTGVLARLVAVGRDVAAAASPTCSSMRSLPPFEQRADVVAGVEHLDAVGRAMMSPALTRPSPSLLDAQRLRLRVDVHLSSTSLRLRTMSVTSSATSGMVVNSCSAPSILTAVMAAPCSDDSRTRRKRVAQRRPEAALERLAGELAVGRRQRLLIDLQIARADEVAPVLRDESALPDVCAPAVAIYLSAESLSECSCRSAPSRLRSDLPAPSNLLRVELDDELLVDRHGQVFAGRAALQLALEVLLVELQPRGRRGGRRRRGSR